MSRFARGSVLCQCAILRGDTWSVSKFDLTTFSHASERKSLQPMSWPVVHGRHATLMWTSRTQAMDVVCASTNDIWSLKPATKEVMTPPQSPSSSLLSELVLGLNGMLRMHGGGGGVVIVVVVLELGIRAFHRAGVYRLRTLCRGSRYLITS